MCQRYQPNCAYPEGQAAVGPLLKRAEIPLLAVGKRLHLLIPQMAY
jgi:hypothetical protein